MKIIKEQNCIIAILVVLIISKTGLFAQTENVTELNSNNSINNYLKEYNVPAIGIGIIEDGELRSIEVYGELKKQTPAPYNTIFNVASLTKPIVTMLTLTLVSNGDWDLDESLANYWIDPDVKDDPLHKKLTTRHVYGFDVINNIVADHLGLQK